MKNLYTMAAIVIALTGLSLTAGNNWWGSPSRINQTRGYRPVSSQQDSQNNGYNNYNNNGIDRSGMRSGMKPNQNQSSRGFMNTFSR